MVGFYLGPTMGHYVLIFLHEINSSKYSPKINNNMIIRFNVGVIFGQ